MYIFKNALKCIGRAKGRNILIGTIVLVIALSACLGLSIRQAAESAKEETLSTMTVTATIAFDRQSMMSGMGGGKGGGSFDRAQFSSAMEEASSLTLEEYLLYASAGSVKDFYYTSTAYFNGTDAFLPVTTDTSFSGSSEISGTIEYEKPSDMEVGGGKMTWPVGSGISGDFTVIGYSGESAMTSFLSGTASVSEGGTVFTEGEATYECIISEELAVFNTLSVGDTVEIANPANGDETYTLTVVGLYTDSSANTGDFSRVGFTASDPANRIYISHATLQAIIDASEAAAAQTDGTAVTGVLSATYVFANVEDYGQFEEEVRALGLDDSYTVSSTDLTAFENSMIPLNTLSKMAGTFLIVILVIGAVILVVLNIFNVRERKYEIGVLTAMGMKKGKVALQFLTEIFVVTLIAVVIGAGIGAVCAVPVTNALLASQVSSQTSHSNQIEQNFGRPGTVSGSLPAGKGSVGQFFGSEGAVANYITEIHSAMNLTVVLQMLGIAILLTLVAGTVSMLFVMRYEPLKILANRD